MIEPINMFMEDLLLLHPIRYNKDFRDFFDIDKKMSEEGGMKKPAVSVPLLGVGSQERFVSFLGKKTNA